MRRSGRRCRFLLGLLSAAVLAGCLGKTPSAVYYTLSPTASEVARPARPAAGDLAVGIGPVKLPDELDRAAIVTRSGSHRLEINEFRRWGGSLKKNVTRVIEENLAYLLQSDRIMSRPWEGHFQPDVRIALDIRRFDGRLGEHAELNATWVLIDPEDGTQLHVGRTILQEATEGDDYDALAAAQSRALARLCREIADALTDQYPPR
jgi:uncharacterized lipoprotein YmbA